MNPVLASELADCRVRDLRRAAARRAGHHHRPAPLRCQIGFALIEAGLRLVTAAADGRPAREPG